MKLQATVTDTHAGAQFSDKQRRVTLTVAEATSMYNNIKIPSDDLREDEALTILVLRQDEAAEYFNDLRSGFVTPAIKRLGELLRPDPPPPWETSVVKMKPPKPTCNGNRTGYHTCGLPIGGCQLPQPDDATTQEFQLGGTA